MTRNILRPMALSLVALFACSTEKGDSSTDSTDGSSSDGSSTAGAATESTSDAPEPTGATEGGSSTSDDSSTGDPGNTTSQTGEGGQPCIDTPTVLALGDDTPLGVTAEALLADKLGVRGTTLAFLEEPLTLSDAWKGKQFKLDVELRHEGGEIRWVDSEPDPEYDPSAGEGFPFECQDRLEIDVAFDFVTEALEFDEHRTGTLRATSADRAELRIKLLPPGLDGSFDPATLYSDPEWEVTGIEIGAIFEGTAVGGSLLNEVVVGGDVGWAGYGEVAQWGDPIEGF